jgi:hypothetical protein
MISLDNDDLEVTLKMLDIDYWYGVKKNICICTDIFNNNSDLRKLIDEFLYNNGFTYDVINYGNDCGEMPDDLYIYKKGSK